nr:hypothetical protein [Micromonospora sp. DSM 115978]
MDSIVNHVPVLLGEVGTARAERGGWSQTAEFASLVLNAGWTWAATAQLAGWLASGQARPSVGVLRGALAGGLALVCATTTYYATDLLFDGGVWWDSTTRYWLIGSLLLGPPLGLVGALIRRPDPVGTLAVLLVPVGAALQMAVLPPPPESLMAWPVRISVWLAAGIFIVAATRVNSRRGRSAPYQVAD